ncbi:hypothetical protein SCUCBS95973_003243 [Sporothrix curviconia]|uniref:Fe2OG dioxygenase domain-containing protein n=1 Tax=Sporothrix curviconia TaxID=1260050 RepID=A0ABP0BDM4_9PEZI
MPRTLPIDLSNFPAFRTRKALLVLDLQNEFLSPSGTLPVSTPEGYVQRTLDVATKFRESGSGDVFWIRSQFHAHRPAAASQIITSSTAQLSGATSSRLSSARGRRREPEPPADDQDADPEAFLSVGASPPDELLLQKKRNQSLLPGSHGSELAPLIASSVNARQDLVIAKSHYSAFESTQLLNRLRTRFVTELYICGALTNISIYATALDAARHGLTLTIIDDCCGYRDITRHYNAISSLVQLTGCDTVSAEYVLESIAPQSSDEAPAVNDFAAAIAAITAASNGPPRARRTTKQAAAGPIEVGGGSPGASGGNSGGLPSLPLPNSKSQDAPASGEKENPALSRSSPTAEIVPDDGPEASQPLQPVRPVVAKDTVAAKPTASAPVTTTAPAITKDTVTATKAPDSPSTGPPAKEASSTATPEPKQSPNRAIVPAPSNRQTLASIEPAKIDAGEITPGEDGDEDDDHPDESFASKVPSQHEKLLEYSRLRSSRNADALKKRLKDAAKESAAVRASQPQAKKPPTAKPVPSAVDTTPGQPDSTAKAMASNSRDTKEDKAASPAVSPASPDAAAAKTPGNDGKSHPKPPPDAEADAEDSETDAKLVPVDTTKEPSATEPICAGDTIIYHDVLPASLEDGIYERLRDEVQWLRMSHQGGEVPRLVCVQGDVDKDGSIPIYRHPADESPPLEAFTPTVREIKRAVENVVGHPLNHALIQLYRTGNDYISEHSDKTLDIVPGSYVCNMSLGAERTMIFRTKRMDKDPSRKEESPSAGNDAATVTPTPTPTPTPAESGNKRQSCRVQLPHNSLCRMGLQTNMKWLHAIRQDKRISREKTPAELAYGGGRISLTFRQIGTFLSADQTLIWGQGAVGKTRNEARAVVNGQSDEAIRMLQAFGTENHSSTFDWAKHYGKGFDVLHMSCSPRFFASADPVVNMTIQLFLADLGISYARGSMSGGGGGGGGTPADKKEDKKNVADAAAEEKPETVHVMASAPSSSSLDVSVRLVDNDRDRSVVQGVLAILLYLDAVYNAQPKARSAQHRHLDTARKYTRLQQALRLQDRWRAASNTEKAPASASDAAATGTSADTPTFSLRPLKSELALWDGYLPETSESTEDTEGAGDDSVVAFIAGGSVPSVADFALWSVLHSMEAAAGGKDGVLAPELQRLGANNLARYYTAFKARDCVTKVLAAEDNK